MEGLVKGGRKRQANLISKVVLHFNFSDSEVAIVSLALLCPSQSNANSYYTPHILVEKVRVRKIKVIQDLPFGFPRLLVSCHPKPLH